MTRDTEELIHIPAMDRAILAIEDLHMRWTAADHAFTVEMIAEVAENWTSSEKSAEELAAFLCTFVMEAMDQS